MTSAMFASVSAVLLVAAVTSATADDPRLDQYKYVTTDTRLESRYDQQENDVWYWRTRAQETLEEKLNARPIKGVAKNVILFLGDGMSIPTLTAARIYLGQLSNQSGEDSRLSFERFPYSGLSKTYCVDKQVADSACSSTAYLGGVKANYGTLGVTASVHRGNCTKSLETKVHVDTILSWAQAADKATGLVTTTRITHASPAGHYAHSADRDWESDKDMLTLKFKADPTVCQDVASQLVNNLPGKDCKVLLGGGRSKFIPVNTLHSGGEGERQDGRSLIKEWQQDKMSRGRPEYVANREQLLEVDIERTDYLMGLFNADHMKYHLEEGSEEQPTLAEMTEVAIKMLQKEKKGFYLFVEGGKIDLAHHQNFGQRALDETVEFHKAVQMALSLVDIKDTLVVVTADHAHTMSMAGYPLRGDDILGAHSQGDDKLPYTTLSYANGPSASNGTGLRRDVTKDDFYNITYRYPSMVPLVDETHGGDDVAVYAWGPWAHLLVGNYEQTLIPHVMAYAARIGPLHPSKLRGHLQEPSSSALNMPVSMFILAALVVIRLFQ